MLIAKRNARLIVATATMTVALLGLGRPSEPLAQEEKREFKNLQVLHKDISEQDLEALMKSFTQALGVRCEHCHVRRNDGQRSQWDFPADEKQEKSTARAMLKMVQDINQNHLAKLGNGEHPRTIRCATCHRGQTEPQTTGEALDAAYAAGGADSAIAEFRFLHDTEFGGGSYELRDRALNAFASQLMDDSALTDASKVLTVNTEFYPNSENAYYLMAYVAMEKSDTVAAIANLEKVVAINPENRRAKRDLDELQGKN